MPKLPMPMLDRFKLIDDEFGSASTENAQAQQFYEEIKRYNRNEINSDQMSRSIDKMWTEYRQKVPGNFAQAGQLKAYIEQVDQLNQKIIEYNQEPKTKLLNELDHMRREFNKNFPGQLEQFAAHIEKEYKGFASSPMNDPVVPLSPPSNPFSMSPPNFGHHQAPQMNQSVSENVPLFQSNSFSMSPAFAHHQAPQTNQSVPRTSKNDANAGANFADKLKNLSEEQFNQLLLALRSTKTIVAWDSPLKGQHIFNLPAELAGFTVESRIDKFNSGGINNNKMVHITDAQGNEFVLGAQYRFGQTLKDDSRLEQQYKNNLVPIHFQKKTEYPVNGKIETVVLQLAEFSRGKDISAFQQGLHEQIMTNKQESRYYDENNDIKNVIKEALDIGEKMASVVARFERDGYMFSDMKNSNWMREENQSLRIVDRKSITPGPIDTNSLLLTVIPPEPKDTIQPQSLHSYVLGKNIYQILTGVSEADLCLPMELDEYCKAPAYKTPAGKALLKLVKELTADDPAQRPTVEKAMERLQEIKNLSLNKTIADSIEEKPVAKEQQMEKNRGFKKIFQFFKRESSTTIH